jgi:hypothetical protein
MRLLLKHTQTEGGQGFQSCEVSVVDNASDTATDRPVWASLPDEIKEFEKCQRK